jgi:hypothetical protein
MVSFVELLDPNNPKVSSAFARLLKIPAGMFAAPSIVANGNTSETPVEHSTFHHPNNGFEVLDNMFGSSALASWAERQDELIDQLFGKNDMSSGLSSLSEVFYRYWKYPVTGVLMVAALCSVEQTAFRFKRIFLYCTDLCLIVEGAQGN